MLRHECSPPPSTICRPPVPWPHRPVTSPDTVARLGTSVQVTRWLAKTGFPAVQPLPVGQLAAGEGCAVTFWRCLPQDGPPPVPADLGHLLRWLRAQLPAGRPDTE